jgi:signal transduction histidine kinase
MERVGLVANLLAIAFRMQDTQVSLTRITQEVYKMNAQLHQLDKLKDDFVSIASHELRTPMTAIRSYVWMAINRSDMQLSERMKRYLQRTLISTERLINLVNDMLNISRIESGRVDIRPQPFSLGTLITDVIFEVDAKAKERGVTVVCPQVQLPNVFADADKVHQVLLNLIGNALKFTPKGGRIDLLTFSDGNYVEVSIKDNGVGISKEDLYKLFTKFGRLDNSYVAAATSGGTGLGLYICKSLVELMGGKIKASSEGIGKGTTFTFSLPIATAQMIKDAEDRRTLPRGEAKGLEPVAI